MELLIVLAIIGVIMSVAVIAIGNIRESTRNVRRLSDIKQIQSALELYRANERTYPNTISTGQALLGSTSSSTYMIQIPTNPTPRNDGICPNDNYLYQNNATGTSYKIDFCLSTPTGNLTAGEKCATPQGILNRNCFLCGDSVIDSRDAQLYPTILIGTQCWMAKNLNVGTQIKGNTDATNNNVIEKYCFNNDANKCATDGGLYQWSEAMQYITTESAQGLCPTGWHIPTDAEQNTLDQFLNDTTCNANRLGAWDCANAGTKLKAGGISHFEGLLTGIRWPSGAFNGEWGAMFWSSTNIYQSGLLPEVRLLGAGVWAVSRDRYEVTFGFSIRCLKN